MEDTESLSDETLFPQGRLHRMAGFGDLVYQREYWRDGSGRVHRIEDMSLRHRRNLINWLERHAERIKSAVEWQMALGPQPGGDMACDAFEAEQERIWEADPRDWLDSTPLMRRLRKVQRKAAGL